MEAYKYKREDTDGFGTKPFHVSTDKLIRSQSTEATPSVAAAYRCSLKS